MTIRTLVWILGQGGFLGSALTDFYLNRGDCVFPATAIHWNDSTSRFRDFKANLQKFLGSAPAGHRRIVWAAGSSGVGTNDSAVDMEFESFTEFVTSLRMQGNFEGLAFYLCSSAGGVYARSVNPPFSSTTAAKPQSRYGELKVSMEKLALDQLASHIPVTIGRISNLYGPWNGPRQGLINRLCRAAIERSALNLFVPMGTIRDYLYIADAAQLIGESTVSPQRGTRIEVVASGIATTIAQAISTVSSVAHRKVPVSIGTDETANEQPEDLRLVPSWKETNSNFTPIDLAAGSHRVLENLTILPRIPATR